MSDNGQAKLGKIDPTKLKLRELAAAERQVGRRIGGELMSGDLGIDTMQALLWIALRRQNPAATFEEAGELDQDAFMALFEDEEDAAEPDPTSGTAERSSGTSPGGVNSQPTPSSTFSGG